MQKITITVDKEGNVAMVAEGFTGTSCADAIKKLESVMGLQEVTKSFTSDYYKDQVSNVEAKHD